MDLIYYKQTDIQWWQ